MTTTTKNGHFSDEALDGVVGGLNPQPLPPGPDPERFSTRSSASYSAINQNSFTTNSSTFR